MGGITRPGRKPEWSADGYGNDGRLLRLFGLDEIEEDHQEGEDPRVMDGVLMLAQPVMARGIDRKITLPNLTADPLHFFHY
jgi:hypothetical protein